MSALLVIATATGFALTPTGVATALAALSILVIGVKMTRALARVEFTAEQTNKSVSRIETKQDKDSERIDALVSRVGVVEVRVEGLANQQQTQHSENLTGLWAQGEQMADVLKYMADKTLEAALNNKR